MTPVPVPATSVDEWLPKLGWHFESFCRDGALTPDGLVQDVRDKERQLWLAVEGDEVHAALLTSVAEDNYQTLVVTHCAGRGRRGWLHLFAFVEDWARGIGCKRIEAITRPGWERVLGMKKTHVVLERML